MLENKTINESGALPVDVFADLEATLEEVAESNPRINSTDTGSKHSEDLRAILEASLAINSSLESDEILQIVMRKAIELMQAERGLVMLLDNNKVLQIKAAFNLDSEKMTPEETKISSSIAKQVVDTSKAIYTSDALSDERYANKQSVVELHLRSIMCVPLKVKDELVGVIYLDNSSQSKMFLKSDLYLFELYAQMVSNAIDNARIYKSIYQLERYNDSVIKKSPVGIIVIDPKCQIATINSISLEIFDINKENIQTLKDSQQPTNFIDILPEKEKARWRYMINSTLATKEEFSNDRYFHNTGYVEKVLSLKISPLEQLTNGSDGLIMTVEDITDKVLLEKYVILSEKLVAKGEMAASIAHELNNYLAIASNNAELLNINIERGKLDKVQFNSKAIVENIFKIKRFVDSLMDFSKPQTEFINYDIKHLIEDLLFSLRIQPRFKQTHFTIDLSQDIPNVEIDVGLIQQVFMNLLNNAADAIEEKIIALENKDVQITKEISIVSSYETEINAVKISISDSGLGMTEETLQKIFTKHFTTKKSGHGLGLANCKNIIEQHKGKMEVESVYGKGTTFHITLPRTNH
ncbi:MAG TPA: GAF domain-containing sensor histidine kinase, partial [candidate division Zixibacteria bacterium]|nr:GAF domain-containing sensor histidine kinase [candidate division Zixibacteria bacterium]